MEKAFPSGEGGLPQAVDEGGQLSLDECVLTAVLHIPSAQVASLNHLPPGRSFALQKTAPEFQVLSFRWNQIPLVGACAQM